MTSNVPRGSTFIFNDEAARILPSSLALYRIAALQFTTWCGNEGLDPLTADDWDDLLVLWKTEQAITRSSSLMP